MVSTFLALGSNLGAREHYLKKGIESLGMYGVEVVKTAGIYETEPREVADQPWFLNTVVQANTNLAPAQLLTVCLSIENENQRVRLRPKTARTLDIDIIFYGEQTYVGPELTIPHPRFSHRRFVLTPLVEIAPNHVDPVTGKTVGELLRQCSDESEVRRLEEIP
jgi:2-amino-4-hydroxy-6-hydroxymethyldihydropteridine diphosphokinase